ncbi:hypothetical protein, partial [Klebsiella pneumoniae]|uniref:hypothetical protein n=1 Tax=Klebsiella pneumoniae TaxID=573 RepID=UPI003F520F8A
AFSSVTVNLGQGLTTDTTLTFDSSTVNGPGTLTNAVGRTLTLNFSTVNAPLVNNGTLVARNNPNSINGAFTSGADSLLRV